MLSAVEVASDLFTTFHADTPDGERFLQTLNGRFLCFALISYISPQKSSNIHAIYYALSPQIGETDGLFGK